MFRRIVARLLAGLVCAAAPLAALVPAEVLVVANANSAASKSIAAHFARAHHLSAGQVFFLDAPEREEIERDVYDRQIARPVGAYLRRRGWVERILAIVTTSGVPLKIAGPGGLAGMAASVDSELAALYQDLHARPHALPGPLANPYFGKEVSFRHPDFPIYLVTRLTAFTTAEAAALVDRAGAARDRGRFVLDMRNDELDDGNYWLKTAARRLPPARVVLDESPRVVRDVRDVIGYASWGSNDRQHRQRDLGMVFCAGALASEFVSTNARTFAEPPRAWRLGEWGKRETYFSNSPQSVSGDFVRQGATGVSGHVYEPYLEFTPRPQILFPTYLAGRTLAESFYASIPAVSWMNVVVGDPLCRLR